MTEEKPQVSPERAARTGRMVLAICAVFFALFAAALGAYAVFQFHDYAVRTSPPGDRTTAVEIEDVTEGEHCSSSGKNIRCSPEYTLAYVVDGERHTTPVRKELEVGDTVHAFEGSDGRWYVTEDPGFGNSRVAWMFYAGGGAVSLVLALLCLRSRAKVPKPT
jgi:hypothetical protein